jgi:hypothetical protein
MLQRKPDGTALDRTHSPLGYGFQWLINIGGYRLMKQLLAAVSALTLVLAFAGVAVAAPVSQHQAFAPMRPVGNSGVSGFAVLVERPQGGTHITVIATGLMAGHTYLSLYYSNHVCAIEPYDASDVIGGKPYVGLPGSIGTTHGNVDDDLDEINSVSVRDAATFQLLACANVHP